MPLRPLEAHQDHPTFERPLYVGRPNVGDRAAFMARVDQILEARWFSNDGPTVREFERRVAEALGVRACVAVCNGTMALSVAARAAGLTGEVVLPSWTYAATAQALDWIGLTPVFCDVDPLTHGIDPRQVEHLITAQTSAVLGVHLWGRPCAIDELVEIAARRKVALLFDAAHAFGCSYRGVKIGAFGDAEIFSFHATKIVSTFEGGAIVSNDPAFVERCRGLRNFGFRDSETVVGPGTNAKMSEICAAFGLTSLDSIDQFVTKNRMIYEAYAWHLASVPGVALARFDEREANNYQYVVVEVDERKTGISRDTLLQVLHAENVFAKRYFYPGCHRATHWDASHTRRPLPNTERLVERTLVLPTGADLGTDEVRIICEIIASAVARSGNHRRPNPASEGRSLE